MNNDFMFRFVKGQFVERVELMIEITQESQKIFPKYMYDKIQKLIDSLISLEDYISNKVDDWEMVTKDFSEISSIIADIIISVNDLDKEKELIRIKCIIPASIIEATYETYNHIADTLRKINLEIKGGNVQWNKILI